MQTWLLDKFLILAESQGFTSGRIQTPDRTTLAILPIAGNAEKETVDAFIGEIKNFFELQPGTYRIIAKRKNSAPSSTECIYLVTSSVKEAAQQPINAVNGLTPKDYAEIKKEALASAKQELERLRLLKEIEDLKKEKRMAMEPTARLMAIAEHLFMKYAEHTKILPKQAAPALNGTVMQEPKTYTAEEQQIVADAIDLFLKHASPNFLYQLAKKVDENPSLVATVSSFLKISQ